MLSRCHCRERRHLMPCRQPLRLPSAIIYFTCRLIRQLDATSFRHYATLIATLDASADIY